MKTQKFEWEGCSSGKIVDRSGEKFVEFFIGDKKLLAPVEREWAELNSSTMEEQVETIIDPEHWQLALPAIDLPEEAKDQFFSNFTEPEAIKNRQVAHRGLIANNFNNEAELIRMALFYWEQKQKDYKMNADAMHNPDLLLPIGWSIGDAFSKLIVDGNAPALRRIIKIVENGNCVPPSQRGGLGSVEGEVLRNWCKLHVESRALPTWGDVRIACGFTQDEETIGRKAFGKFGLAVKTSEQT